MVVKVVVSAMEMAASQQVGLRIRDGRGHGSREGYGDDDRGEGGPIAASMFAKKTAASGQPSSSTCDSSSSSIEDAFSGTDDSIGGGGGGGEGGEKELALNRDELSIGSHVLFSRILRGGEREMEENGSITVSSTITTDKNYQVLGEEGSQLREEEEDGEVTSFSKRDRNLRPGLLLGSGDRTVVVISSAPDASAGLVAAACSGDEKKDGDVATSRETMELSEVSKASSATIADVVDVALTLDAEENEEEEEEVCRVCQCSEADEEGEMALAILGVSSPLGYRSYVDGSGGGRRPSQSKSRSESRSRSEEWAVTKTKFGGIYDVEKRRRRGVVSDSGDRLWPADGNVGEACGIGWAGRGIALENRGKEGDGDARVGSPSPSLKGEEEEEEDLESGAVGVGKRKSGHHKPSLVVLGCACKNELAMAHYACALRWFASRASLTCEICGQNAGTIKGEDMKKIECAVKERRRSLVGTATAMAATERNGGRVRGEESEEDLPSTISPDPTELRVMDAAAWFDPRARDTRSTRAARLAMAAGGGTGQRRDLEAEMLSVSPAMKRIVEGTGIILATGLLTLTVSKLFTPLVGQNLANMGFNYIIGGVLAVVIVVWFRLVVLPRIRSGPTRYWAVLLFFWFLIFGVWGLGTMIPRTT